MSDNIKNCNHTIEPYMPNDFELVAPTTEPQREIWSSDAMSPEASCAFNLSISIILKGNLDMNALRRALEILPQRHEVLRMTFNDNGHSFYIHKKSDYCIPFVDLSDTSSILKKPSVDDIVHKEITTPFDLMKGPLWRPIIIKTAETTHIILITVHHIICDGWSLSVMRRELRFLYGELTSGRHVSTETISRFSKYSELMTFQAATTEHAEDEQYWLNRFSSETPVIDLPIDHPRPSMRSYNSASINRTIAPEIASQLRNASNASGNSLFSLLFAVYCILVRRLSGNEAVVIGVPVAGQPLVEQYDLMGHCVHFLPVLQNVPLDIPFNDFLQSVSDTLFDAQDHHSCTFGSLLKKLKLSRDPSRIPLVPLCLTYTTLSNMDIEPFHGLETDDVSNSKRYETFELNIDITDIAGRIDLRCHFNVNLFEDATINRFLGYFETIALSFVKQQTLAIGSIPLMSQNEWQQVVIDWNSTAVALPFETTLPRLFEEQVLRSPDAPAVLYEGETLSYRQLDNWSNNIAELLTQKGAGPGSFIALCSERSLEMVAGLMGILKSGAAYVPIDPAYPDVRIAYILSDAKPLAVLAQRDMIDTFAPSSPVVVIPLEDTYVPQKSAPQPLLRVNPEDIAYVIYTSGSTGVPKGVMIPHRGICNRLLWMQQEFVLTSNDRILQKTNYTFDVSVWEFFWPLITGAGLVMARPGGHRDAAYLTTTIRSAEITIIHFVPSMLGFFTEEADASRCESLRYVICSGEALTPVHRDNFFKNMPTHTRLFNLYGPTEASVDVSFWECKREDTRPLVPIGRPVANTKLYVLDESLNPVPKGVNGELYIGGVQVGTGYLNNKDLTKKSFVADPFDPNPNCRLYKTGDIVRFQNDGAILYIGRADHQVKIRGNRVELGEIEKTLQQHPGVCEAVVMADGISSDKRLIAAIVPSATGTVPLVSDLKSFLKTLLPDYMIPSAFTVVDSLPLLPNGKIDRKALAKSEFKTVDFRSNIVAPENETQRIIADLWSKELNLSSISVMDNFFDIGGHSLLLVELSLRLQKIFGSRVTTMSLFQFPTIASLSEYIDFEKKQDDIEQQASERANMQRKRLQRAKSRGNELLE